MIKKAGGQNHGPFGIEAGKNFRIIKNHDTHGSAVKFRTAEQHEKD